MLLYITGYCRAGPYLVGVVTAYFLHQFLKSEKQVNEVNFKFLKKFLIFVLKIWWSYGWYFTGLCTFGSILLGWPFFTTTKVDPMLTALYAATFRSVFALGISFIIVYGVYKKEGKFFFNLLIKHNYFPTVPFLSAKPLFVLSKISYSVYLIHTLWIQLSYSWIRSPLHLTDGFQVSLILSDLVICTIIGGVFHLLVEAPLSEIFQKKVK